MMTAMFEEINTKYGDSTDLRLFFYDRTIQ